MTAVPRMGDNHCMNWLDQVKWDERGLVPAIAQEAVRLLQAAGVPREALQLLHGPGETVGAALVAHPATAGVCFTGSTQVAKIIQRTLAASIGFDTSTIGGVVDRLEARGWVKRQVSPEDRRARLLQVTPEGKQLLQELSASVLSTQERILAPLPQAERQEFLRMLKVLVATNNDASRAPRLVD